MIIPFPTACPQARFGSDAFPTSIPGPAASRRAWATLLASWLRREAELAAADTEREIDATLVRQIEAARQRIVTARTRAERTMASNAMRVLSAVRISDEVFLELERGLA
jgi:hypothetical protein